MIPTDKNWSAMRFEHAHVAVAACQLLRQMLMTGRYPHRFEALGLISSTRALQPSIEKPLCKSGVPGDSHTWRSSHWIKVNEVLYVYFKDARPTNTKPPSKSYFHNSDKCRKYLSIDRILECF